MKQSRGYIFIEALIAMTLLLSLMAIMAANQRANVQDIQNRIEQRQADAAVDAGIARALGEIESANSNIVTQTDDWETLGSNGDEQFTLANTGASFRVQMVDANSMLDLNYATQAQLELLPLEPEQVDCLLDWRSAGETPRSDGAKDSFYNSLLVPYNAKLGPLTTVDEALLIDNWTGETLYQPPTLASNVTLPNSVLGVTLPLASMFTVDSGAPNTQASGAARINFSRGGISARQLQFYGISPGQANLIASINPNSGGRGGRGGGGVAPGQGVTPPYSSFSQLLGVRGLNSLTCAALLNVATFTNSTRVQGKLNINTASDAALQTLPAMPTGLDQTIVQQQSDGFQTLGQIATIPGMSPPVLALMADNFTIGSDTWIVHIYGQSGSATSAVEAVVGLRSGLPQIISYTKLHTVGIPSWWNWNTQTSATGDAGSMQ